MKIPLVESMIAASCETSFEAIEREESERSFSDIYFFLFGTWVRCIPHCPPEGGFSFASSTHAGIRAGGPRHNPQAPAGSLRPPTTANGMQFMVLSKTKHKHCLT